MNVPEFIKTIDWNLTVLKCIEQSVNPYLIAAIGWHETHWGRLGWGTQGYILGVGCFNEKEADESWKGLSRQLDFATTTLSKYYLFLPNYNQINKYAHEVWKPGEPTKWAKAVHNYYVKYLDQYAIDFYSYVPIPLYARGTMYTLYKNNKINTPFGDTTFYRIMFLLHEKFNLI